MNTKEFILRRVVKYILLALIVGLVFYMVKRRETVYCHGSTLFTTMSTSAVADIYVEEESFNPALEAIRNSIRDTEKLCNIFDPASELSRLNATAHEKPFACSNELWELLAEARKFYSFSEGAFDISIGPLMELWGFHRKKGRLPSQEEIQETLKRVGLDKVEFDDHAKTVRFKASGMKLNLGGIAKGWALDRAIRAAGEHGVKHGYIDLGGNTFALKNIPTLNRKFTVGIRNPLNKEETIATTTMENTCVSTSGNYERYVVIDGHHYTHIVNPKTGLPVENMLSVSVITPRGVDSDALSTSIFVKGPEFAEKVIQNFPGTRILIYRRNPDDPSKIDCFPFGSNWTYQKEASWPVSPVPSQRSPP